MIGASDWFGEIFGNTPEGDISWNARVAKTAVREGLGIVLVYPNDKVAACTLTSEQAQKADIKAQDAAKEAGNLGWANVRHKCGVDHVITDEKDLNKVGAKRLLADGANIAIAPGKGTFRVALVDLDTRDQVEAFSALWKEHTGESIDLTVSSPGVLDDGGTWRHKDGGHIWFGVPDDVELPENKGRFTWCKCHEFRPWIDDPKNPGKKITCPEAFAFYWGSGYALTPPSVRPEGPYRLMGSAVELPAWLSDMAKDTVTHSGGKAGTGELSRFADDPIDEWSQEIEWSDILIQDGFTPAGRDNCGCPTFTRPGDATHSKSVTAHEMGCSLTWDDTSSGHLPMHIWSDALGGDRTLSKLSWIAENRFAGDMRAAMEHFNLRKMRETADLGFEFEAETDENPENDKDDVTEIPEWRRELNKVPDHLRKAVTDRASETYIARRATRIVDLRIAAETGYAVDWDSRAVNGADWLSTDAPEINPLWGTTETPLWVSGESIMFAGPPGVGKSTLAQMLVWGSLGLVPDVLGYPVSALDDGGILYLAMDRPEQIKRAMGRLVRRAFPERADEIIATAAKMLTVWGGPLPGDMTADKRLLVNMAERFGRTRIIVDSIKDPLPNASDETRAGGYNTARQEALANGIEWIEIHHNRKSNGDNKEPNKLDDVYGSTWLTSGAGSVLSLFGQPGETVLSLKHLKTPGEPLNPMWVELHRSTGLVTVQEQITPEIILASCGTDGATAEEVAMKLAGIVPGLKLPEGTRRSMVQNARNKLNRLVKAKRVETFEGSDGVTRFRLIGAGLVLDGGNA